MAKNTNGPFSTELSSSSIAPCSPNEIAISSEDCVEGDVEKWLEDEVAGFRVWQLAGIILSILLTVVIGLCCCIRFRVPRTKQDIEADYIRKKITKSFRNELATISNTEMDEMDLRKALDIIRIKFDADIRTPEKQSDETMKANTPYGFRARVNAVFSGIRIRMTKREHVELNNII